MTSKPNSNPKRKTIKAYNYVYKIIQLSTGREYIGKHGTDNLNDGYMGSGTLITPAVESNPSDFVKTIIWYCDSESEMNELEAALVTEEYLLENFPEKTFNQVPGGESDLASIVKWQKILYPEKSRVGRGANAGKIKVALVDKNIWIFPDKFDDTIHSRTLNKNHKPYKKRENHVSIIPDNIRHAFKMWKSRNKSKMSIEAYDKWEQRVLSKNEDLTKEILSHFRLQIM